MKNRVAAQANGPQQSALSPAQVKIGPPEPMLHLPSELLGEDRQWTDGAWYRLVKHSEFVWELQRTEQVGT